MPDAAATAAPTTDQPVADDWAWSATPGDPPPVRLLARLEGWTKDGRGDGRGPSVPARVVGVALLIGRAVAAGASTLLFTVVAVVGILVPWAFQRVLQVDPLAGRRDRTTRWVERAPTASHPGHPWSVDPARRPVRPFRRVRVAAAGLLLVGATVVVILDQQPALRARQLRAEPVPAAYADVDWWPDYHHELDYLGNVEVFNPFERNHVGDVDLRYIDVRAGVRTSWVPPGCGSCPTVRVWMYGGSTTFGFGQRNEHTIPSELARLAWADGIRLEIENRGVPGDTHWEEAQRFALDVTAFDPPDLVVFYDGVNDIAATNRRNGEGERDRTDLPTLNLDDERRRFRDLRDGDLFGLIHTDGLTPPPGGGTVPDPPPTPIADVATTAREAVAGYERARVVSRALGEETDVPIVWSWSPTRFTRPPQPDEPHADAASEASVRELYGLAAEALADDVVDLSQSLDDVAGPLFYDDVHHNEKGARGVALDLYAAIADRLPDAEGER